jgi:hypothetical protein
MAKMGRIAARVTARMTAGEGLAEAETMTARMTGNVRAVL